MFQNNNHTWLYSQRRKTERDDKNSFNVYSSHEGKSWLGEEKTQASLRRIPSKLSQTDWKPAQAEQLSAFPLSFNNIFLCILLNWINRFLITQRRPFLKPLHSTQNTEPKFLVILWELKPVTVLGESQLRHGVADATQNVCSKTFVVLEISRQIQMCSTNRIVLPHTPPFPS